MLSRPIAGSTLTVSDAITFAIPSQRFFPVLAGIKFRSVNTVPLIGTVLIAGHSSGSELENKSALNAILVRSSTFRTENAFLLDTGQYWLHSVDLHRCSQWYSTTILAALNWRIKVP
jgi:hypothetical protein